MPFQFESLQVPGVIVITPKVFQDQRGFFMECYKQSEFISGGISEAFIQENQSLSGRGTLRGLHYQRPPCAQGKLVRVIAGEIFDVAVDLRKGSPTEGKWVGVTLSAENRRLLYIPPWCGHGFCVMSEVAEVLYKTTQEYAPQYESGIAWNDAKLGIRWPIDNPILSDRDRKWPPFQPLEYDESAAVLKP